MLVTCISGVGDNWYDYATSWAGDVPLSHEGVQLLVYLSPVFTCQNSKGGNARAVSMLFDVLHDGVVQVLLLYGHE